jgi:hypothetical protein
MAERITETVGTLRKNCPSCGQPIESFQTRYPSCGHELNAAEVSGVFKAFLDEMEAYRNKELKSKNSNKRELWFLNTYVLPNTKEDLLELLVFVTNKYTTEKIDRWERKSRQIYAKARLCLKTDPGTLKIMEEILQENGITVQQGGQRNG